MKTKTKPRPCHPHYMRPKGKKLICRTCFMPMATRRAVILTAHIDWHRREGHRVRLEYGYEDELQEAAS